MKIAIIMEGRLERRINNEEINFFTQGPALKVINIEALNAINTAKIVVNIARIKVTKKGDQKEAPLEWICPDIEKSVVKNILLNP